MDRYRRTNPQNSSKIIQRAVDEKVQKRLQANVRNASSTGLGKQPDSKTYKHLQQRRNKAMQMQDSWNRIVEENVRLLKRTREIALRDHLPPVRSQLTHKSLNEPFKQRKQKQIAKYNHVLGNRLYRAKACVDMSAPKSLQYRVGIDGKRGAGSGKGKNKKKKKKTSSKSRKTVGSGASDSPFAPGRPFTGEIIRPSLSADDTLRTPSRRHGF